MLRYGRQRSDFMNVEEKSQEDQASRLFVKKPNLLWGGAATDVGRVRDENQDAFVAVPEIGLFLVSEGMGALRKESWPQILL